MLDVAVNKSSLRSLAVANFAIRAASLRASSELSVML